MGERYYLTKRAVSPEIYMKLTDNWINLNIRYVTDVRQRRMIHNRLSQAILDEIRNSSNIEIASETFDIVGFPEVSNQLIN